jgi:hypothetical protein
MDESSVPNIMLHPSKFDTVTSASMRMRDGVPPSTVVPYPSIFTDSPSAGIPEANLIGVAKLGMVSLTSIMS